MTELGYGTASAGVVQEFLPLVGQPARLTFDEPAHGGRKRLTGLLTAVTEASLTVETLGTDSDGLTPPIPVALEVLVKEDLVCYACTLIKQHNNTAYLSLPSKGRMEQRREFPRVDVDLPVHVGGLALRPVAAQLQDVSAGGACVLSMIPAVPGQQLTLVFNLGSGLFLQGLDAVVVRSTPTSGGTYAIGLRLNASAEQQASLAAWVKKKLTLY